MKRLVCVAAWLLVLGAGALVPARAQETRFELDAGVQYPLVSQQFYAEQSLGYHLRFGVRLSPKFTLAGVYELQNTTSAVRKRPRA
jgi:hypothetical protein